MYDKERDLVRAFVAGKLDRRELFRGVSRLGLGAAEKLRRPLRLEAGDDEVDQRRATARLAALVAAVLEKSLDLLPFGSRNAGTPVEHTRNRRHGYAGGGGDLGEGRVLLGHPCSFIG